MSTRTASFGPGTTLYGTCLISCVTSEYLRPMNRLIEKTVRSGFNAACRLAICPTRRSPVLVKATTDGVVRPPSLLTITVGLSPSIVATTELVVPRSIPTAFAILQLLSKFQKSQSETRNRIIRTLQSRLPWAIGFDLQFTLHVKQTRYTFRSDK